jgi:hypothetical protein
MPKIKTAESSRHICLVVVEQHFEIVSWLKILLCHVCDILHIDIWYFEDIFLMESSYP